MPSDRLVPWRDRYVELAREGEAQGLTFTALGDYIAQRMTDTELRSMLAEGAPILEAAREQAPKATHRPPQERPRVVEREARYRNDG